MELLYLILGWLLGLLSPLIVNRISRSYSKRELFNGIKTEVVECQFRALLVSHLLGLRYGKYDKEFLEWCLPYLRNYRGDEPTENTIKTITTFLETKDEDIKKLIVIKRSQEERMGLTLKRFNLPFLDSKISEVSCFCIELQNIIYEIRSRLQIINDEIDLAIKYFQMTFDSSISDSNHDIIKKDLTQKYMNLQNQLIKFVKKMDKLVNYNNRI